MSDTIVITICFVIALPGILIGTGILAIKILGALFPSRFGAGKEPSPNIDSNFENDTYLLIINPPEQLHNNHLTFPFDMQE